MTKILNLVLSTVLESDYNTGDPIRETGLNLIKKYNDNNIVNSFFLYVIKLGDKHCTKIDYGNAFTIGQGILHSVKKEILERVRNNTVKILISWPMESFLQDRIFELMHSYFKYHNIPNSNVIYLSCCPNGKELYNAYCQHNNISEKLNIEYIPWYLYSSTIYKSKEYVPGRRKKKFFNLNRRMHLHRMLFVLKVFKEKLNDNFYISFPNSQPNSKEKFLDIAMNNHLRYLQEYNIDENDITEFNKLLPLRIDIKEWNTYPLPIKSEKLDVYYQNSLFSIVSETYFFSKIIHLTEKTFKPIINRHPFIMISAPYTLRKIREFGFKTFGDIIDESYDEIEDDELRFDTIMNLVREISLWGPRRISQVSVQIKEIVDFNYDLMQSRPRFELNSFIEKYGVECR